MITKFIIRWGATGSTAKWAGKHYMRLREKNPELSRKEILKKLVDFRYKTINLNNAKDQLLERLEYIDNLTDFTFSILQLEDAINTKEMDRGLQSEVITVIMEELEKQGVPDNAIVGEGEY